MGPGCHMTHRSASTSHFSQQATEGDFLWVALLRLLLFVFQRPNRVQPVCTYPECTSVVSYRRRDVPHAMPTNITHTDSHTDPQLAVKANRVVFRSVPGQLLSLSLALPDGGQMGRQQFATSRTLKKSPALPQFSHHSWPRPPSWLRPLPRQDVIT